MIRDAWWHCEFCGDHGPANEPYKVGDSEPCTRCGEGVSRVMTTKQAAKLESDIARGLAEPRRAYSTPEAPRHELVTPRERDDWHEDLGAMLWWAFPITEPPYCGTPLDDDFPEYVTHYTPIPEVASPQGPAPAPEGEG